MGDLRVLQEIHVSPSPPLPSQTPQLLSILDAIWLRSPPVEWLFFYDFPHPISHFIDNHLHTFTTSLSLTLRHFYPFAGSVCPSTASPDQFEIIYNEGDSVTVTIAEFTGNDFHDISSHRPRNVNNLRLLVPRPPNSAWGQSPPLSVQVTIFSNQGLCIAFLGNHAVCDASGFMQFIRSWTAVCRSSESLLSDGAPLLDRSVIVDSYGLRQKMLERARKYPEIYAELMKQIVAKPFSPDLIACTFTLRKDQITQLKKQVQAKIMEDDASSFHISGFVVACAYVMRCLVKVRGYDDDHENYLYFVVDWRSRMKPPIASNYFGNCLGACITEPVKTCKISGKDGFEVVAMEIGRTIRELQEKDAGEVLEKTFVMYMELFNVNMPLSVAGSPKLGVYRTDFGWGRPAKVEIVSIAESGAMSLIESREEEGGLEIGLVLLEEEMGVFGANFRTDLLDV